MSVNFSVSVYVYVYNLFHLSSVFPAVLSTGCATTSDAHPLSACMDMYVKRGEISVYWHAMSDTSIVKGHDRRT